MEPNRMELLEQRIENLEKEVKALKNAQIAESSIEQIETHPVVQPIEKEVGEPNKVVRNGKTIQFKTREGQQSQRTEPVATPSPSKKAEPVDWEHLIGRVWIPRIFIFVLLLGLTFAFTIVAIAGTELIRIVMGFGLAGILYIIGEKQVKKERDGLGKVLLSGSISVAILTTFAMHVQYQMIPSIMAFVLNIVWIFLGIQLSKKHKSEAIAILTACVGYLVPFLLEGKENAATLFIGYETVFYAFLLLYAIQNNYKKLFYTASVLWHLVVMLFISTLPWEVNTDTIVLSAAIGAIIQHLLFVYFGQFKKTLDIPVLPILFTSFVVTTFWARTGFVFDPIYMEDVVIDTWKNQILYDVYLVVAAFGYGIMAYKGWRSQREEQVPVGLSISTLSIALLIFHVIDSETVGGMIYLVQGMIALYLGYYFKATLQKATGALVYAVGVVTTLLNTIDDVFSLETLAWIILMGSLYALYKLVKEHHSDNKAIKGIVLGANAFVQIIFLSSIVGAITEDWSISLRMMSLSFAWAIYAVAGIVIGFILDKKNIRLIGMVFLFITLCKLIFVDLYTVNLFVRTILFIGLGATGLFVSRLFYTKK